LINNLRLLVEGRGHLGACIMHVELMHVEVGVCHELVGSLLASVVMLAKVAACRDSSCSPRRFASSREGPARRGASACRGGSCSPWRSTKLRLAGEVQGLPRIVEDGREASARRRRSRSFGSPGRFRACRRGRRGCRLLALNNFGLRR